MPAIKKTIHFAFERGERVWLVCDPLASGTVDGYTLREGYLPRYIVAFPSGASTHSDHELTRDEPNPFSTEPSEDE